MISFKKVQVFKDQILGVGSYGTVYKAKCDDLPCAAKVLHPTMLATHPQAIAHKKNRIAPIRKFEQEIELLSAIRHPYVVQYLGTHQDSDTGLPMLLMELMDHNLTWFLCSNDKPLPYCLQVNICHDISVALSFLHSNSIIHRDLSSNNVLLIGNARAKVTDFGVAKLSSFEMSTLSKNPGTDAFMPPEATKPVPEYTEKIDCFSFGVLIVQIVTRLAPKPAERLKEVVYHHGHSGYGQRKVYEIATEIERRQNHITKIDSNHPLLPIALNCLDDQDIKRPTAHELCESMETLRKSSEYQISEGIVSCSAEEVRSCTESSILLAQKRINEQHTEELVQKDQLIAALQEENRKLKDVRCLASDQEENKRQLVDETRKFKLVIDELESQVSDMHLEQNSSDIKILWKRQSKAPCHMSRSCDATVCADGVAYFRPAHTSKIYAFDSPQFFQLPDCPLNSCSITMINNQLTTVGGYLLGAGHFNKLFTFKENGNTGTWMEEFPPMPTKRRWTTAVGTRMVLIVIGGAQNDNILKTVEVMNIASREWYTAADIPEGLFSISATLCGDRIYMLGGKPNFRYQRSRSVYTCSLSDLIQSCSFTSAEQNMPLTTVPTSSTTNAVWRKVADLDVELSTCVSYHGQLLAVGGERHSASSKNIYLYDATADSWNVISQMPIPRIACFAAVLNNRELVIVGGCNLDSVEIASLSIS